MREENVEDKAVCDTFRHLREQIGHRVRGVPSLESSFCWSMSIEVCLPLSWHRFWIRKILR
jgi:hypothetical protein